MNAPSPIRHADMPDVWSTPPNAPNGTTDDTSDGSLTPLSGKPGQAMIARVWHGKTLKSQADEYQQYLAAAIQKFLTFKGNLGYQMMRLDDGPAGGEHVEFQVVSYWETLDAIKAFAGEAIQRVNDLPRDPDFLVDKEDAVRNYQLVVNAIRA